MGSGASQLKDASQKEVSEAYAALSGEEKKKLAEALSLVSKEDPMSKEEAAQLLDRAQEELRAMTNMDIQEVKAMKFPPPQLALAFEVVGALLQKPHSGWEDVKKMIEDEKAFLEQLASLSIMDVPGEVLVEVGSYLNNPELQEEEVKKVSRAATILLRFVKGVHRFVAAARAA